MLSSPAVKFRIGYINQRSYFRIGYYLWTLISSTIYEEFVTSQLFLDMVEVFAALSKKRLPRGS